MWAAPSGWFMEGAHGNAVTVIMARISNPAPARWNHSNDRKIPSCETEREREREREREHWAPTSIIRGTVRGQYRPPISRSSRCPLTRKNGAASIRWRPRPPPPPPPPPPRPRPPLGRRFIFHGVATSRLQFRLISLSKKIYIFTSPSSARDWKIHRRCLCRATAQVLNVIQFRSAPSTKDRSSAKNQMDWTDQHRLQREPHCMDGSVEAIQHFQGSVIDRVGPVLPVHGCNRILVQFSGRSAVPLELILVGNQLDGTGAPNVSVRSSFYEDFFLLLRFFLNFKVEFNLT